MLLLRSHDIRHHSLETQRSTDIYYCTSAQLNVIRLEAQQGLSITHDRIWERFELALFQNMLSKSGIQESPTRKGVPEKEK